MWIETEEELEKWLKAIHLLTFRRVKAISVHCIEALLRKNSLGQEGIFRLSGSASLVAKLKSQYDVADYPNLMDVKDEHAITGLMKTAIRSVPEPLLTFSRYEAFCNAGLLVDPERTARIKELVATLPQANKGFLCYLMHFVHRVAAHQETSKMTSKNLAVVFAPNILHPLVEDFAYMNAQPQILACVETMISNAPQIWPQAPSFSLEAEPPTVDVEPEPEPDSASDSDDDEAPPPKPKLSTPPLSPRFKAPGSNSPTGRTMSPPPLPGANLPQLPAGIGAPPSRTMSEHSRVASAPSGALAALASVFAKPPPAGGPAPIRELTDDDSQVSMSTNPLLQSGALSPRAEPARPAHTKTASMGGIMMG